MYKNYKKAVGFLAFILLMTVGNLNVKAQITDYGITRLAGATRYNTSLEICDYGWKSGSTSVILASGKNFPDALCASPLSYKYSAPIILTEGNTLSSDIIDRITKLGVRNVYIVGGTGVISGSIETQLKYMNISVIRLGGADRYETSIKVAKQIGGNKICVVSGQNFPDALSISGIAASEQMPIILTMQNSVPAMVRNYISGLRPSKSYIIGGTGVISDNTAKIFGNTDRVAGADRYETNYEVVKKFYGDIDYTSIYMTSAQNYPDGICASALAGRSKSPVFLINDNMSSSQIKLIRDIKERISERVVVGGEAVAPGYASERMFAEGTSITPEDYMNEYKNKIDTDAVSAIKSLQQGQYLYPKDLTLNNFINNEAADILDMAKEIHQNGDYNNAISLYSALLKINIPDAVRIQAIIFRNVAESGNKIISKYVYNDNYKQAVQSGLNYYRKNNLKYVDNIEYTAMGDFMDFSEIANFKVSATLKYDDNGLPMVKYGSNFYYNPVTLSQYALYLHSFYVKGDTSKLSDFLKCADFLAKYVSPDGSLRYKFDFGDFKSGWTSGMAQGEALAVLSRAYKLTGDTKYIDCGNKIFNYLITSVQDGGVMDNLGYLDPSYKDFIFFQEYVNETPSYTLNGNIFAVLGVYDWYQLGKTTDLINSDLVGHFYKESIKSLKVVIPYYDLGGYTSYNLYHLTAGYSPVNANLYHPVHIELLQALYSITKDPFFMDMRNQWIDYVN